MAEDNNKILPDPGTVSLGISNPKNAENMGSVLRAAKCYGVSAVWFTGQRFHYARRFNTDTQQAARQIPTVGCDDLLAMRPRGASIVAVELVEGATPLPAFEHPDNAYYLFGPEDGSLDQTTLDGCDAVVYIPTNGCMNLAATVNVLLYDRLAKRPCSVDNVGWVQATRDTNNRTRKKPTDA
ncbi:RNA methyltransferase [Aestuariibacter halophilus]|uniref:RNA methyltransferase n=1 Tax=Fluctibacter halophilus TaxID=226011 RepID=A0ABS8G436_9ALTE|nr:RNA methyltransferase [Aestuariibacter halophilus]MCC2615357.1 RNA methyltransferase [Aestuariibacter halophilus]